MDVGKRVLLWVVISTLLCSVCFASELSEAVINVGLLVGLMFIVFLFAAVGTFYIGRCKERTKEGVDLYNYTNMALGILFCSISGISIWSVLFQMMLISELMSHASFYNALFVAYGWTIFPILIAGLFISVVYLIVRIFTWVAELKKSSKGGKDGF